MNSYKPIIGISMGDPAGIGPEIIVKTMAEKKMNESCRPLVVGDAKVMRKAIEICKSNLKINAIHSVSQAKFKEGFINVLDLDNMNLENFKYGVVSAEAGKSAFESVKKVIELALTSEIDATVTGPINKKSINEAGYHYSGHTEIYAELTKSKNYTMMLAHDNLRVVHVSTHVSLRQACDLVKKDRVLAVIELAHETMKAYGIQNPKIAVAGLNPHSSEDGLFGSEEEEEIIPAVEAAIKLGFNVEGPLPPDTVFSKAKGGIYDIVVAMYHDQGHIPLKVTGFVWDDKKQNWNSVSGVNITLGLPIIRTSVDHGTAFGKAGNGTANPESLINAIDFAVVLSNNKKTE